MREAKKDMKNGIIDDDDDTEVKKMLLSNGYQIRVVPRVLRARDLHKG